MPIPHDINCGQFTIWDAYTLNILAVPHQRPAQCVASDPDNHLCQLIGDYTLNLNDYASKPVYPHMAEKCPGKPPFYERPDDC